MSGGGSVKAGRAGGAGARREPPTAEPAEATAEGDSEYGDTDAEEQLGPGRRVRIAALVLSLLGLADATYLTVTHFQKQVLECPANSFINCLKVTTSPQSEILHIPVAILGLAFYVAMTIINLPPLWTTTDRRVAWLRLVMAVTGIGFVLYLVYAELFIIKAICEYCTGVHVITFALFILIVTTFPSMLQRGGGWDDGDGWDEAEHEDEAEVVST